MLIDLPVPDIRNGSTGYLIPVSLITPAIAFATKYRKPCQNLLTLLKNIPKKQVCDPGPGKIIHTSSTCFHTGVGSKITHFAGFRHTLLTWCMVSIFLKDVQNFPSLFFTVLLRHSIFAGMSAEKIISEWKKGVFKPVYWLEGEEVFFIDQVVNYAERHILNEAEAGFNLTVFYGKDADWSSVVNACMRYPMFAERQVVLLKEAQQMRDIEKLEGYIDKPLASTVFVVSYKEKKVDGRSKLARILKQKGELLTTKKMYESQLPEWAAGMIKQHGLTISQKALRLLVDNIGNDLSRMQNEVEKLAVNLGARKDITEDDIEQYIGVSKEFNVFELQSAVAQKDLAKAIRIIQYFEANPKAAPIQLVLPSLYNFFSKVFILYGIPGLDEKTAATTLGVNPYFVKDYLQTARKYDYAGVERILLLLHQYNLRSIGVHDAGTADAGLMKEMVVKMMA